MELYNLDIDSNKKFNFLVMENSFSVLNLPKYDYDCIAKKAFYIEGISQDDKIICKIKTLFHPIKVLKFDTISLKWEEIEIEYNEAAVTFKISKSGFYLAVLENFDKSVEKVKISNNHPCSKPFFLNRDRTFFSNEKILKDEEVEVITFSSYNPYELYQKMVKKNEKDIKIEINPQYEKGKKFHDLYYGEWDRAALKKDGKKIEKDRNKIELLGNMSLIENNYIVFEDNGVLLEGKFEILDKDKILLNIKSINYPLLANGYSEFYKISPSLFENELVIPSFFSFYAGNLQFSFDEICFSRRKNFYKTDNSYIEAEYVNFYKTIFPHDEKNTRFKIYFFKGRY